MVNNGRSEKSQQSQQVNESRQDQTTPSEAEFQGLASQTGIMSDSDLLHDEAANGDAPPPAYGDVYGQLQGDRAGLDSSARVMDDGRVNIRVNGLNRRLSQVFTPALRQHLQDVQHDNKPSPAYIPPGLGTKPGVSPPPSLNVVMHVVGSRGDVQPFVALAKVLKANYGHRVRLATHPVFKDFVQDNGLEFFSIGGDPSQLMTFMVKNPGLMPGFSSLVSGDVKQRRRDVAEYLQGCWRSCYRTGDGMDANAGEDVPPADQSARPFVADCIIANPPSFAHIHCAEKLGIPLHIMFTMPYSPTQAFPHPLANIHSSNADPHLTNYISYAMIELLVWQGIGDIINRFRTKCLALDPISLIWGPGMLQRLKIPHTYCWSPALIPKPKDWASHISITGFSFLSTDYTPSQDLQAFLDAGPAPIYIGFGSIVLDDPNAMTELIFQVAKITRQRILLSKGWSGLGSDGLSVPYGVFMLDNVPHDWLFRHVSCVVHHGGAGTTAAGIAAGRPTIVVPFFGDQPFWGAMVARAGAGPSPIPHKLLTVDRLVDAISFCLKPESLTRAQQLAEKIAAERGSETGAQSFHQSLDVDRLRCTLSLSRSATWRIKRTKITLSSFAACTLANANLLNFHDLKLFRPEEYQTEEGSLDPISGGLAAVVGSFNGMIMGIMTVPSETYKTLRLPMRSGRKPGQATSQSSAVGTDSGIVSTSTLTADNFSPSPQIDGPSVLDPLSSGTKDMRSPSSTSSSPQAKPALVRAGTSQSRTSQSGKTKNIPRLLGSQPSQGVGRFTKSLIQGPMNIAVNLTNGSHNLPKAWGDNTVRPITKITDFKSGVRATGKDFAYGWYDGITGLAMQPYQGARQDGAGGFVKGIGKGMAGFVAKPLAGTLGILSNPWKGIHKEVQRAYRGSVQDYIFASRRAQGYEEWLRASEAEKQEVIDKWTVVQKYMKKKRANEEMLQDLLAAHGRSRVPDDGHSRSSQATEEARDFDSTTLDSHSMVNRPRSLADSDSIVSIDDADLSDIKNHESNARNNARPASVARCGQNQPQRRVDDGGLVGTGIAQAVPAGQAEPQGHDTEAIGSAAVVNPCQPRRKGKTAMTTEAPPSSHDSGHIEGTTLADFEAGQQRGEKTAEERTEEEIVMAYVKKQSMLEQHHRGKGKSFASKNHEDSDDEDLRRALEMSMQEADAGVGGARVRS